MSLLKELCECFRWTSGLSSTIRLSVPHYIRKQYTKTSCWIFLEVTNVICSHLQFPIQASVYSRRSHSHFIPQLNTLSARQLNEFSLFRKWWWIFYVTNSCSFSWIRRSGVRHRDARLFHFKEPRAFDVPVTLLVFLKELQQNESATEHCSGMEGVLVRRPPVLLCRSKGFQLGMVNFALGRTVNRFLKVFTIHCIIH